MNIKISDQPRYYVFSYEYISGKKGSGFDTDIEGKNLKSELNNLKSFKRTGFCDTESSTELMK